MRILLLGANGFVGSRALQTLVAEGHEVTCAGRTPPKTDVPHEALLLDLADLSEFGSTDLSRIDSIVNCAGSLSGDPAVNLTGPLALARVAAEHGVRRWVQVSSVGAYGPQALGSRVDEHHPLNPQGPYETSKAQADVELEAGDFGDMSITILRPSNIVGVDMRSSWPLFVARFACLRWIPVPCHDATIPMVGVGSVAVAVARAVALPDLTDLRMNLSAAVPVSSLTRTVGANRARLVMVPRPALAAGNRLSNGFGYGSAYRLVFGDTRYDSSQAIEVLGMGDQLDVEKQLTAFQKAIAR